MFSVSRCLFKLRCYFNKVGIRKIMYLAMSMIFGIMGFMPVVPPTYFHFLLLILFERFKLYMYTNFTHSKEFNKNSLNYELKCNTALQL